jgi:hypothetical protein
MSERIQVHTIKQCAQCKHGSDPVDTGERWPMLVYRKTCRLSGIKIAPGKFGTIPARCQLEKAT